MVLVMLSDNGGRLVMVVKGMGVKSGLGTV